MCHSITKDKNLLLSLEKNFLFMFQEGNHTKWLPQRAGLFYSWESIKLLAIIIFL